MLSKRSTTELHPSPRRDFLCQLSVLTSSASSSILLDTQGLNQLLPAPPSCPHCPPNKDIRSVLSSIVWVRHPLSAILKFRCIKKTKPPLPFQKRCIWVTILIFKMMQRCFSLVFMWLFPCGGMKVSNFEMSHNLKGCCQVTKVYNPRFITSVPRVAVIQYFCGLGRTFILYIIYIVFLCLLYSILQKETICQSRPLQLFSLPEDPPTGMQELVPSESKKMTSSWSLSTLSLGRQSVPLGYHNNGHMTFLGRNHTTQ